MIPEHYLNTSDHLPISCTFTSESTYTSQQYQTKDSNSIPNYMWNNDVFVKTYNDLIFQHLTQLSETLDTSEEIARFHQILKECAVKAFNDLKQTSFHFIKTKPWWNTELNKKKNTLQKMFNIWKESGFPRDTSDTSYNCYCFARKDFRLLSKKCKNQSTTDHYVNIEKIKKTKPRSYWRQIQLAKSNENKLYTINNKTKIDDITKEFNSHFDHLLNTPRTDNIRNAESNNHLIELLGTLDENRNIDFHVSEQDICVAINGMNKNKTSDPFDIKAEHYIYCINDTSLSYLTRLINKIMVSTKLPPALSTSLIVPIMKSHRKPIQDANNYRGISLIPILTKIIEKIIINKCPQLKQHKNTQFGFTTDASTIHAELLISDTITHYNEKNSPVYICSLDAEKAFDSCNWFLLFNKLKKKTSFLT